MMPGREDRRANVMVEIYARRVATAIQGMTGASDIVREGLTRALIEFAEEIKREAIEP